MTYTLADLALEVLTVGVDEPYGFSAAGLSRVQAALEAAIAGPDLKAQVLELVAFARFVAEVQACPKAASALLEVAATATEALRRCSAPESMERMRRRATSFSVFLGGAAPSRPTPRAPVAQSAESRALRARQLAVRLVG